LEFIRLLKGLSDLAVHVAYEGNVTENRDFRVKERFSSAKDLWNVWMGNSYLWNSMMQHKNRIKVTKSLHVLLGIADTLLYI